MRVADRNRIESRGRMMSFEPLYTVVPARGARDQAIVVKTYVKFTQLGPIVGNHASSKILISVVLIGLLNKYWSRCFTRNAS